MEVLTLLALLLMPVASPASEGSTATAFSQDSALAVLRYLSVDIGPRPMGSPAEQRALQFAVEQFRSHGCDEAYLMPMSSAHGVNTQSGVAIGVVKGKTGRIIIIGGHMDSAGPEIPGTNDDGSGAACVIELARVLAQRQHESTLMFCCWGGEEQGLEGSKYFVEHFDKLDSVVLMLQIDMADGASILEIDPDYAGVSAPRWLVTAAYDVFYNELRSEGLVYPVASATLNSAAGGSTGSDHDSFLEKGIPAIDFTSDVDYPIHTPQDNIANFTPSGLKKSGDLVLKLTERFDGGVPSRSTERYMLLQVGTTPWFVPQVGLWLVGILSIALAVFAFFTLRRRHNAGGGSPVRWSAFKLVLFTIVIQACIWLSETMFGLARGMRFPWVNNYDGFVALGLAAGLIGLWIVLQAIKRLPLDQRFFPFAWRSLLYLSLITVLTALLSARLAVFFALATAFMSAAFLVRSSIARVMLWGLSLLIVVRLVFFEELGLIQRTISENRIHSMGGSVMYELAFIALFTFLSLPFVFGFAALYRSSGTDLLWLRRFRGRWGIIFAAGFVACISALLTNRPVYGAKWYSNILVEQRHSLGTDSSAIEIKGSEYFRGARMNSGNAEVLLPERTNFYRPTLATPSNVGWLSIERSLNIAADTGDSRIISRVTNIHSVFRPYIVVATYRSEEPFTIESPHSHGGGIRYGRESSRHKFFAWYSFPDTGITLPVTFRVKHGQRISETVEATFDSLAAGLRISKALTNIQYRTIVTARDTFSTDVPESEGH